ncbi:MAG: hypothetical protein XD49_1630 [Caldanaerobacter subterraneus]|jgi:uncharacterized protein|uniref:Uncharacterized protein n=1 Tax=Caldanaerobacter subterraneus TaxID=911092 RepID=A0A101E4B1_9THEO|nr:hypothetical protein [Caldanaerobacter subterraneus]KUK08314.1 MAG: hypothetical protein XD49_1630 [Caldanaerobacter subterraneus]TCO57495.1 hypothetical protein EV203_13117 [Caldanaerobacter subterraneus]HBT48349.1 hypothetical protein [Caldanaerobacter subterraneus]
MELDILGLTPQPPRRLDPIEKAMTKTAKEWEKIRNKAKSDEEWIYYNALKRLREAIDRKHKLDIELWSFNVSSLEEKLFF